MQPFSTAIAVYVIFSVFIVVSVNSTGNEETSEHWPNTSNYLKTIKSHLFGNVRYNVTEPNHAPGNSRTDGKTKETVYGKNRKLKNKWTGNNRTNEYSSENVRYRNNRSKEYFPGNFQYRNNRTRGHYPGNVRYRENGRGHGNRFIRRRDKKHGKKRRHNVFRGESMDPRGEVVQSRENNSETSLDSIMQGVARGNIPKDFPGNNEDIIETWNSSAVEGGYDTGIATTALHNNGVGEANSTIFDGGNLRERTGKTFRDSIKQFSLLVDKVYIYIRNIIDYTLIAILSLLVMIIIIKTMIYQDFNTKVNKYILMINSSVILSALLSMVMIMFSYESFSFKTLLMFLFDLNYLVILVLYYFSSLIVIIPQKIEVGRYTMRPMTLVAVLVLFDLIMVLTNAKVKIFAQEAYWSLVFTTVTYCFLLTQATVASVLVTLIIFSQLRSIDLIFSLDFNKDKSVFIKDISSNFYTTEEYMKIIRCIKKKFKTFVAASTFFALFSLLSFLVKVEELNIFQDAWTKLLTFGLGFCFLTTLHASIPIPAKTAGTCQTFKKLCCSKKKKEISSSTSFDLKDTVIRIDGNIVSLNNEKENCGFKYLSLQSQKSSPAMPPQVTATQDLFIGNTNPNPFFHHQSFNSLPPFECYSPISIKRHFADTSTLRSENNILTDYNRRQQIDYGRKQVNRKQSNASLQSPKSRYYEKQISRYLEQEKAKVSPVRRSTFTGNSIPVYDNRRDVAAFDEEEKKFNRTFNKLNRNLTDQIKSKNEERNIYFNSNQQQQQQQQQQWIDETESEIDNIYEEI